ncbi:acyltransferase [Bacteroidia bacterium]|nr:acyltransferase [Bacteroidia bacterium]
MKQIYSLLLKIAGWRSSVEITIPSKCVICVAPHTSNWDFLIGMLFYKSIGGKPHFLMKKTWFFFPLKYFLTAIGGFPVNRTKNSSLTETMAEEFSRHEEFQLAIAPEGTRKKNPHWKSGFYYIAWKAQVPITLAYLDYTKKIIGIMSNFIPTGDVEGDIAQIKQFYENIPGKYPGKFAI